LGVEKFNEGSQQLRKALNAELTAGRKGKPQSRESVRRSVATRREPGTLHIPNRWAETGWTPEQLALPGTLPDQELAEQSGRTQNAVRQKREELGIANPATNRWSPEEIALLGTLHDEELSRKLGRSRSTVTEKRIALGIPLTCDRRRKEHRA